MIIHQLQKKVKNKQIIIFCVSFVKHVFYDTNVRVFWGMTKSSLEHVYLTLCLTVTLIIKADICFRD